MQRSRKALLHRRALESAILGRKRLYKVYVSIIFIFCGLLSLLWIGHDNSYRGKSETALLLLFFNSCFYFL